jgi:hypothetical protein
MFKHRPLACAIAVVAAFVLAGPASAAPPVDSSALRDAVTVSGITEHQAALEAIANDNVFEGVPTRATGTPGHEASVEYVVEKMEAAGFDVSLQPFEADIFFEQAPAAFEQVAPNRDRLSALRRREWRLVHRGLLGRWRCDRRGSRCGLR